jgi:hypothetical protein
MCYNLQNIQGLPSRTQDFEALLSSMVKLNSKFRIDAGFLCDNTSKTGAVLRNMTKYAACKKMTFLNK